MLEHSLPRHGWIQRVPAALAAACPSPEALNEVVGHQAQHAQCPYRIALGAPDTGIFLPLHVEAAKHVIFRPPVQPDTAEDLPAVAFVPGQGGQEVAILVGAVAIVVAGCLPDQPSLCQVLPSANAVFEAGERAGSPKRPSGAPSSTRTGSPKLAPDLATASFLPGGFRLCLLVPCFFLEQKLGFFEQLRLVVLEPKDISEPDLSDSVGVAPRDQAGIEAEHIEPDALPVGGSGICSTQGRASVLTRVARNAGASQ